MSLKLENPAQKIKGNFLVGKGNDVWAYYTCPLENIVGQNQEAQEKHKRNLGQFIQSLGRYKDFEICLNPMSFNLAERLEKLEEEFSQEYFELAKNISERSVEVLEKELKYLTTEKFFIGVKLNAVSSAESLKNRIWEQIDYFSSKILSSSGYILDIDEDFLSRFGVVEENLFQTVGMIKGRRLKEDELKHLCRYNYVRGLESSMNQNKNMLSDSYSLTDTIINPCDNQGVLELKSFEGTTYVSLLPISNFPKNLAYNHVVEQVQELPFPVEFRFKGHFEPLKGSMGIKGKSNRAEKRLKNFAVESLKMGDSEKKSSKLNRYILDDLNNKIDKKVPIIKWQSVFVVFGDTVKECKKRVARLCSYTESMNIEVKKGLADQISLFHNFLQGNSLGIEKKWIHYTDKEGITEMLIGTDNRIGDHVGFPIGRVSTLNNVSGLKPENIARGCRKPVFLNPFLANQPDVKDKASSSPHIAITGPTGGGKSFLAKSIFFFCSLLKGRGLYIDPKSEYKQWIIKVIENPYYQKKYKLFVDYLKSFHFVTLDANKKENYGVLDPIIFLKGTDAFDTAETIFEQIYDFSLKEDARTEMLKGIKKIISQREDGKKVGLMSVIEYLKSSEIEEARKVGRAIYERVEGSILQLAFSSGDTEGLSLNSKVTILGIQGLEVPKASDSEKNYTSSQRKSIALMFCLGKFCAKFGLADINENTFVMFDEAWIFSSSRGGQEIIKSMRRVGRSQNNMMILITQSINDTRTDDDEGNFGRVFAFDNPDERVEILEMVHLEKAESNVEWLKKMPQYHCLYLDIYGRVGRMLVYCPFEEVRESFRTVVENRSGNIEEMFAS